MSKSISDIILLEDTILQQYGIFNQHESEKEEWIKDSFDGGKLYYELHDKIINKRDIVRYTDICNNIEINIIKFIAETITTDEYEVFNEVLYYFSTLKEHKHSKDAQMKTKLGKLTKNIMMDKVSNLSNIYSIPIDTFVILKYNLNATFASNNKNDEIDLLLDQYKECLELLKQAKKYVDTKTKYLTLRVEMYNNGNTAKYDEFMYAKKQYGKHINKNWSNLKLEEKHERFESYVTSRFVAKSAEFIDRLCQFIKDEYKNSIKYNNIKWNKQLGIVYHINNIIIDDTDSISVKTISKPTLIKSKTCLAMPTMNEEILYYILFINISIDNCIQKIQDRLKITKLTYIEKKKIAKVYNDMYEIIKQHEYIEE
jgi:hypothetical protein